ncbi:MAG: metal ABC transporter substrate-binding protein, partial [Hungatella sp.]
MRFKIQKLIGVLWIVLCLGGCAQAPGQKLALEPAAADKINVVTTLFPYYDFARQIAGDQLELTMVIPAGMDSHSFEPTPADILTIRNADILVCNGGEMEQWLEQVLEAIDPSGMTVLSMMDYVDTVEEEQVEGMELGKNAHHAH